MCASRANCSVISILSGTPICECYSDCYEYGDCCSDVSHVENCVGECTVQSKFHNLKWVILTDEECETGEIRLVGGVTNSVGRLEVCANGIWGRVCNRLQYWGPDNAKVVCRQLGFSEDGNLNTIIYHFMHVYVDAYVVNDANVFGESDRNPLLGEVHCVGTEPDLFECSHSSVGIHSCGRHQTPVPDIAISCYGMLGNTQSSMSRNMHIHLCTINYAYLLCI